ncbi:MAG: ATP-binding domain-containing protein, partial [Cyanobacteria bacterium HKST-UBA06]|nr:ATP-binding domain-containing protein [Cyanobacteria bacterium HKST-UBA06]
KSAVYNGIWTKPRQEAEARRLFYVALTRAKKQLTVIRHRRAPDWTQIT